MAGLRLLLAWTPLVVVVSTLEHEMLVTLLWHPGVYRGGVLLVRVGAHNFFLLKSNRRPLKGRQVIASDDDNDMHDKAYHMVCRRG